MSNLILIDSSLPDLQIILNSLEISTSYVLFDYQIDTFDSILQNINKLGKTFDTVGIMFDDKYLPTFQLVLHTNPAILQNVQNIDPTLVSWQSFFTFLENIKTSVGFQYLDFISCNIHSNLNWDFIIDSLRPEIYIRSADTEIGYGSGWVLESDNVNLIGLYFTTSINNWQYTLGGGANTITTVIIDNSGYVYGCGNNANGQLGLGNTTNQLTFQKLLDLSGQQRLTDPSGAIKNIKQVSCGYLYTILLDNSGYVYGCGINGDGQLGLGNTTQYTTFQKLLDLSGQQHLSDPSNAMVNIKQVTCGAYHTILLDNSGYVYGCGQNTFGQLGLGNTTTPYTTFQKLLDLSGQQRLSDLSNAIVNIKQVSAGGGHTMLVDNSGYVFCCGQNASGQLGLGYTTTQYTTFQKLLDLSGQQHLSDPSGAIVNIKQISCGYLYTILLDNSGYVYGSGFNFYGQFGLGNTIQYTTFQKLLNLSGQQYNNDLSNAMVNINQISGGAYHTILLDNSGYVYGCGRNDYGQLSLGNNNTQYTTFQKLLDLSGQQHLSDLSNAIVNINQVTCGGYHTILLDNSGYVYGCGYNLYGQLGLGNTTTRYTRFQKLLDLSGQQHLSDPSGAMVNIVLLMDSLVPLTLPNNQGNVVCFKVGTKILTNQGYRPIEQLKKGDLLETYKHGQIPIFEIGKKTIYNPASEERIKDQMYVCTKDKYPELFEDLNITGCHGILIDSRDKVTEEDIENSRIVLGDIFVTDECLRLPACVDKRTEVYKEKEYIEIYHIALENDDYYSNYGIYANGLLVESCSKKNLRELANMEFIE